MAFRAVRLAARQATQRSTSSVAKLARTTSALSSNTGALSSTTGVSQRFCTLTRAFGAGSIGGRPRDDDDDDDTRTARRQKFDAFVERGKERLGPERVEKLERLNEKRKVHAAYVREAGKGSELSMSERMKRLVSAYGPLALGFHVTTEVVVCGLFYVAVDHGLDVGALLSYVEALTGMDTSHVVSPGAGSLVVAYALTVALTGIPRTFLTIAATPYIARKLGWRPKKV